MARIGQALITKALAQRFRPTGLVGAVDAAAAGGRLVRLSEDETVHALALAAKTAGGLDEWPRRAAARCSSSRLRGARRGDRGPLRARRR